MSDIHHTFVILDKKALDTGLNALTLMNQGLNLLAENTTHFVFHLKDRGQHLEPTPDPHARIPALYHDYSADN